MTQIIKIDPACLEKAFSRCKEVITSGGVIVYPTDTFYALGVDPKNKTAVRKLFSLKSRQTDQPILLLISGMDAVKDWVIEITPQAERLMKRFWPGPLTLVFKAAKDVLPEITAGTGTVGLRVPGSDLTRQLLTFIGFALTGTSANRSGGNNINSADEAAAVMGNMVDLILDCGETAGGKPSTVVDVTSSKPVIVREGAVSSKDIL